MKYNNIFYFSNINSIGGVETYFYYLAKKYSRNDIAILYKTADANQLARLSKYARCICYNGTPVKCKKAFFSYTIDIINNVIADEYIQIIHANYLEQNVTPNISPKITRFIGVSKEVCKAFEIVSGRKCELCYNPIVIDQPKRIIKLISATRLTKEKGKDRIKRLGWILNQCGIDYIWLVFTNDKKAIDNPNIIYRNPSFDITSYINDADFLVQLSDSEAYCYSVVESLLLGKPVIVTDLPIYNELGLDDTNSIKLPLDFDSLDIKKLYQDYNFTYEPPEDKWNKFLNKGSYKIKEVNKMNVKVVALDTYKKLNIMDSELNCIPEQGTTFEVSKDRLNTLMGNNEYNQPFVKIIEPIEEIKKSVLPKKNVTKRKKNESK